MVSTSHYIPVKSTRNALDSPFTSCLKEEEDDNCTHSQTSKAATRQLDTSARVWQHRAAASPSRRGSKASPKRSARSRRITRQRSSCASSGSTSSWRYSRTARYASSNRTSRRRSSHTTRCPGGETRYLARLPVDGDGRGRELDLRDCDGGDERGGDAAGEDGEAGGDAGGVRGWDCDGGGVGQGRDWARGRWGGDWSCGGHWGAAVGDSSGKAAGWGGCHS